jgi:small-conductance mechanosensitive channel
MSVRHWLFVCSIFSLAGLVSAGAGAQGQPAPAGAPQAASPAQAPAAAQPAAGPKIDTAEIIKRADKNTGVDIDAKIKYWQIALDRIEEALRKPGLRYPELNTFRDDLLRLRANAEEFWRKLEPPLNAAEDQVQKLQPPPAQGQPPESEQEAKFRAEANYALGYLRSARLSLDRTHARINQSINTIQDIRRRNFASNLFQPVPGVFSAQTWQTAADFAKPSAIKVWEMIAGWWRDLHGRDDVIFLAVAALVLWLALSIAGFAGERRLKRWPAGSEPPFWRRASSAAGVVVFRSLPTVIALVFVYNAVEEAEAMPDKVGWLFYIAARSIITIVVVNALITSVLSPSDHRWRLIPASNWAAIRISGLVLMLALIYGATTFIYGATRLAQAPFQLTLASTLPANLLVAALVAAILKVPLGREGADGRASLFWVRALRLLVWLVVIAIVVSAVSGYLALSRFLAQQLIVTGTILAIVYLLLLWAEGFAQAMADETSFMGSWLANTAGLDQTRRGRLAVPVSLLLKFTVLVCSVPLIMLQWGYPWGDIMELYRQLFFGFHIGGTQVSLGAIFASLIVFLLGYFAAKLFQQWLDTQVLTPAGLSHGLRDSIRTGVGYIGIFAALLFALSYAGFPLANLAIVAASFSVGIGFGLQSVVNNFVSGLIMLAERPVKVGDLVVVGGEEGYVRKISVRSTEIETFDRANVLIPNSFFISEKVKNWTLRNNTGRITVPISVAHGCDPRKVKAILLQVAQAHQGIMSSPQPFVDFEDFGGNMLNFKLYAFIYDLNASINIRTDLRIAILDAFKAQGISIPTGQTDVNLRDIDWLRDAVTLYIAQTFDAKSAEPARRPAIPAAEPAE